MSEPEHIARLRAFRDLYWIDPFKAGVSDEGADAIELLSSYDTLQDKVSRLLAYNYDLRKERDRLTDELAETKAINKRLLLLLKEAKSAIEDDPGLRWSARLHAKIDKAIGGGSQ